MSITFVSLPSLARSAGVALALLAGLAPAKTETVKENPAVAPTPADKPASVPPYLVTPGGSDKIAFDQAVAAGNSAALIMFLARNPDAKQAADARQLLAAHKTPDGLAVTQAVAGGDAGVVSAFDAARLVGTRERWDAFLKLHGGHPLAAQVPYFMP